MKNLLLIAAILMSLIACTPKPVYNTSDITIRTASGSQLSLADVRQAIVYGATSKAWIVEDIDATHLQATHRVRSHMAQVVIAYSTSSFSITYKDSVALDYDGTTIHHNYNRWIRNLEQRIREQLNAL